MTQGVLKSSDTLLIDIFRSVYDKQPCSLPSDMKDTLEEGFRTL